MRDDAVSAVAALAGRPESAEIVRKEPRIMRFLLSQLRHPDPWRHLAMGALLQ